MKKHPWFLFSLSLATFIVALVTLVIDPELGYIIGYLSLFLILADFICYKFIDHE